MDFMLLYGKFYLASGGPTSRLEDNLQKIGERFEVPTEVFATPTGIFVTLFGEHQQTTALKRLRGATTDLGNLVELEQLFTEIWEKKTSVSQALKKLGGNDFFQKSYSSWQFALAAFLAGFSISFDSYQHLVAAAVSGIITAIIWFFSNSFLKRHINNPIFADFIGAFLALTLGAMAHGWIRPISIEAYALGSFVLLVPGLALTTAISELAEQNLVSGTAKFMQATLALLALGLAYLLFQQISFSLNLREVLQPATTKIHPSWISGFAVLINVACFGVIFRVPAKRLIWSSLTGLIAWGILQFLVSSSAAAAGPFLASVVVGMLSLWLGGIFRQPSQIFSVPGIVALLPGFLALNSFRYFANGDEDTGVAFTFKVAITAVSIVFGLMTARIPFQVFTTLRKELRDWKKENPS
jgi:uncharacterized membrane protein YjjP (DUF1212 family)